MGPFVVCNQFTEGTGRPGPATSRLGLASAFGEPTSPSELRKQEEKRRLELGNRWTSPDLT